MTYIWFLMTNLVLNDIQLVFNDIQLFFNVVHDRHTIVF